MASDVEWLRANIRQATTEDLLDRVTVYRSAMEPAAMPIIEAELRQRGVDTADIQAHAAQYNSPVLRGPDGTVEMCSFCHRPAVASRWDWQYVFGGTVPLFPRRFRYCAIHQLAPSRGNRPERT